MVEKGCTGCRRYDTCTKPCERIERLLPKEVEFGWREVFFSNLGKADAERLEELEEPRQGDGENDTGELVSETVERPEEIESHRQEGALSGAREVIRDEVARLEGKGASRLDVAIDILRLAGYSFRDIEMVTRAGLCKSAIRKRMAAGA